MEAQVFEECEKCLLLIFPGESVFTHTGEVLCAACHEKVATVFAGVYRCH